MKELKNSIGVALRHPLDLILAFESLRGPLLLIGVLTLIGTVGYKVITWLDAVYQA